MADLEANVEIDAYSKLIINGYIRNIHTLFILDNVVLFDNIPRLIISLCSSYYYDGEYFEKRKSAKHINMTDNKRTVYTNYSFAWSVYGALKIPSTINFIFKWTILVNKCSKNCFRFGICSENAENTKFFNDNNCISYVYDGGDGKIYSNKQLLANWKKYGKRLNGMGDKIQIILNLKRKEISFIINNTNYGVAFKNIIYNEQIYYRLAISFGFRAHISIKQFIAQSTTK